MLCTILLHFFYVNKRNSTRQQTTVKRTMYFKSYIVHQLDHISSVAVYRNNIQFNSVCAQYRLCSTIYYYDFCFAWQWRGRNEIFVLTRLCLCVFYDGQHYAHWQIDTFNKLVNWKQKQFLIRAHFRFFSFCSKNDDGTMNEEMKEKEQ